MNRVLAAAALLAACAGARAQPLAAQSAEALSPAVRELVSVPEPAFAITHVRVIDGTGAAPLADQTVVVENGRITGVGSAASVRVPASARVIDGRDATLIPGLIGLHDHTFYNTAVRSVQQSYSAPRLYLGSGVTTIRTTGSNYPYMEINLRRTIQRGQSPGPRMFITGPYLTGEDASLRKLTLEGAEDARRAVAYWSEEGVDWFKFYTTINREAARAAVDEAHKRGVKVTGHLCSIGYREAVELGMDNVEHGLFANSEYSADKKPDACPANASASQRAIDVNSAAVQQTFRDMIAHNVAMTSTLAVYEAGIPSRAPLEPRMLEAMSPDTRNEYLTQRARVAANERPEQLELLKKGMAYERAFVKAGGLLAAGVDPTGFGGALAGFGDQRNYELLVEAGFSPAEAIQIMTLNGAKVLGIDKETGSIAVGKNADLVLIRGDIAAKPSDIRNVQIVFRDGVGYDSAKLIESVRGQVGIR